MTERENPDRPDDVVELLQAQHARIRVLFDEVVAAEGSERELCVNELVRLLAVHETTEEEVVHPYARRTIDGGDQVVGDRLQEEQRAKHALSRLDGMDVDSPDFLARFAALRQDVLAHADSEERHEFAHLRLAADRSRLDVLARAVKAAEALAPARPHPGADTALKNVALGPIAAVVDRTRDTVRRVADGPA
ncbi:hemerythrin domain-containing protein [Streptomyces sp. NPDC059009]|uniref:hemerythrin domain-containing protein n=1 Tax=Streptomyces sp. NPDC059009 TaxID=3346694 RepID=UPI00367F94D6